MDVVSTGVRASVQGCTPLERLDDGQEFALARGGAIVFVEDRR